MSHLPEPFFFLQTCALVLGLTCALPPCKGSQLLLFFLFGRAYALRLPSLLACLCVFVLCCARDDMAATGQSQQGRILYIHAAWMRTPPRLAGWLDRAHGPACRCTPASGAVHAWTRCTEAGRKSRRGFTWALAFHWRRGEEEVGGRRMLMRPAGPRPAGKKRMAGKPDRKATWTWQISPRGRERESTAEPVRVGPE
ncbi:hypothetical protein GUJ93_ZPchr0013g37190 [Zizania palustris]|uniref:Secreted protein n=1 Tax=Zizania palustris TaxID=103762 RepID=A0A8J5X3C6_ZIZPA|nr:hypothetical protein GUJ93_ZPchr0013g37190 [Zizania palustris]